MEIDKEFHDLVTKLVNQNRDELSREQSQRMDKILQDSASRGWPSPTGQLYREFDDLQVESIRRRGDFVWSALEQTLGVFDPSFYPELATQLHSLAESFFPLSLCEPQDYLRGMGWERPMAEEVNQQLRSSLEMVRCSSLNAVKTKIDLYVAKKRLKPVKRVGKVVYWTNKYWHDPVWSKVIATAIITLLAGCVSYLLDWWPTITSGLIVLLGKR